MKTLAIFFRFLSIRAFYIILSVFLVLGSYFYTIPQVVIGNYILLNPFYSDTEHLANWMYAVDYFIFIFSVAIVIILILIVFYNILKKRREKTDKKFLSTIVDQLFPYLYMVDELTEEEKKRKRKAINKRLKSEHLKRLFLITLVKVHSQTEGVVKEKTARLINTINYKYLLKSYLRSPYVRHKLFALKIISEFRLEGFDKYIVKLVKRKDKILHAEAILTLLKLQVYNNLLFLLDLDMKLTLWDINQIVNTIQESNKRDLNYKILINSTIPEVSAIGMIFARLHGKTEFKSDVVLKMGHSNELVNEEAFRAFISFSETQSDFDFLLEKFGIATRKAQIEIIHIVHKSTDKPKIIHFLKWVVVNKPYVLKIEALKQLLELDLSAISQYKQSGDEMIRQSCLQVLDINL